MALQNQPAFSQLSSKRSLGGRQEKPFANPEWNLLQYLMIEWIKCTELIENGGDSTQMDRDFLLLTELVGTMLS